MGYHNDNDNDSDSDNDNDNDYDPPYDPYEYEDEDEYEARRDVKDAYNNNMTEQTSRAEEKASLNPLRGGCERSCLKLNLLHDGGFNKVCDETTAFNEFPYCDGDPAAGDLFHMRQCIETCRQPATVKDCPNDHTRGNDFRGCKAGKAFRQGLPYEFVTKFGDTIIFPSLLTRIPTREPTRTPTGERTEDPTRAPIGEPTRTPTGEPTRMPRGEPTGEPADEPTGAPTGSFGTRTGTVTLTGTYLAIFIPVLALFFILLAIAIWWRVTKRRQKKEEAETGAAEAGQVGEVVHDVQQALTT